VDRAESLFSVSLIPETIERTTLGRLELGDKINVEVDSQTLAIVETVERVLADPLMREQFLSSQGLS
jgi:riboflavin synthase